MTSHVHKMHFMVSRYLIPGTFESVYYNLRFFDVLGPFSDFYGTDHVFPHKSSIGLGLRCYVSRVLLTLCIASKCL